MSEVKYNDINRIIKSIMQDQNIKISDLGCTEEQFNNDKPWFDMALIKKLEGSNTSSKGAVSSNQSSIILTGEQVNIFPCIRRDTFADKTIGKNIILKSDLKLMSNNILYLKNEEDFKLKTNKVIDSFVTTNETTQNRVELGCKTIDGAKYVEFYETLSNGDVLIILKLASKLEYITLGIKDEDRDKYFNNINLIEKKTISYFDKVNKVTVNTKDSLTYVDSSNYEYEESDRDTKPNKKRYKVKYNKEQIFSDLSMTETPYKIVEHYINNNPKSFKELQDSFKDISNAISKNEYIDFILEKDKIDGYGYKREKNYFNKKRPVIEHNFNDNITNFGVYTQWYNKGKNENFDKFTNSILSLGYIVEEEDTNNIEPVKGAVNKIYFGAPGTGKSKYVNDEYYNQYAKRVTFHPEYTYNDFIGYIKPIVDGEDLTYSFVPGTFTEILVEALNNSHKMYTLIIEELNRANTAAVFGDLFQLLDREESGESEYRVNNPEIYKYIIDSIEDDYEYEDGSIYIPSNLNIIATMNTADQNVFVMDTAFKRRWEFEYIPVVFKDDHDFKNEIISNLNVTWEAFVSRVNEFMMSKENEDLMISEDKQIGPYFIKLNELNNRNKFGYKVLLYLWDDVFKMDKYKLFNKDIRTFSALISEFSNDDGTNIFNPNFIKKLNEKKLEEDKQNE